MDPDTYDFNYRLQNRMPLLQTGFSVFVSSNRFRSVRYSLCKRDYATLLATRSWYHSRGNGYVGCVPVRQVLAVRVYCGNVTNCVRLFKISGNFLWLQETGRVRLIPRLSRRKHRMIESAYPGRGAKTKNKAGWDVYVPISSSVGKFSWNGFKLL